MDINFFERIEIEEKAEGTIISIGFLGTEQRINLGDKKKVEEVEKISFVFNSKRELEEVLCSNVGKVILEDSFWQTFKDVQMTLSLFDKEAGNPIIEDNHIFYVPCKTHEVSTKIPISPLTERPLDDRSDLELFLTVLGGEIFFCYRCMCCKKIIRTSKYDDEIGQHEYGADCDLKKYYDEIEIGMVKALHHM